MSEEGCFAIGLLIGVGVTLVLHVITLRPGYRMWESCRHHKREMHLEKRVRELEKRLKDE
jgi:hypothetical protein